MFAQKPSLTSVDNLGNHIRVTISFLEFGGGDPDLSISWDVFSGFVQNLPRVLVDLQSSKR